LILILGVRLIQNLSIGNVILANAVLLFRLVMAMDQQLKDWKFAVERLFAAEGPTGTKSRAW
jgi:hypothetical protein